MLFNNKIDYLIQLGMKISPIFKNEFLKMIATIPSKYRKKLSCLEDFDSGLIQAFSGKDFSFKVLNTSHEYVTDVKLEVTKVKLKDLIKENIEDNVKEFVFNVNLPNFEKIDESKTDSLSNIETINYENMSLKSLNAEDIEFYFSIVNVNNQYVLILEEYNATLFDVSSKAYKLTSEDIDILTVDNITYKK